MWNGFFPFLPFAMAGRTNNNGTLATSAITVGTDNVTIMLPNGAFRNRPQVGSFFVDIRQQIPTGTTTTLPILIGTNGDTRPLMAYGSTPVTVADIAGTGILELHYNKYTNELFVVNGAHKGAAT